MIHRHKEEFDVSVMCAPLNVSRQGCYAWVDRPPSPAQTRRAELIERIRSAHADSRGLYGGPRVHAELVDQAIDVCRNTVARLMKRAGVRSRIKRRFRARTTDSNHGLPIRANTLDRNFTAQAPNRKRVVDIAYAPTGEGFPYVAAVMDLCSRKIVGWQMADHLRTELCTDALAMALSTRKPSAGLLPHSDRGVQHCCGDYQKPLSENGIECSMSRTGDCFDNAAMESFWGTLKRELVHLENYATRQEARSSIFEYIEVFYNRRRRHSAIGDKSPESYEASLN
jgi:transposase InsO family protein